MRSPKNAKIAYIIYSAALIITGAAFCLNPEAGAELIGTALGILALTSGLVRVISFFADDAYGLAFQFDLAFGFFTAVMGIALLARPKALTAALTVVTGVIMLMGGAFKLQTAKDARRFGMKYWWLILCAGLLSAAVGLGLIFDPFGGSLTLATLIGVGLIAAGVQNIPVVLYTVRSRRNGRSRAEFIETDFEPKN